MLKKLTHEERGERVKYKIGSINLKNLSKSTITKRDFEKIADIIRSEEFDIVALQEILSEGYALE